MKRLWLVLVAIAALSGLGSRFDHDARCKALALEIVKTWWVNGPIVGQQVAPDFYRLQCSETFLEVERQRILRGEVEPWVEVSR